MFQDYTFLTRAFIPKPVSCSYHAITKSLNAIFQTNIVKQSFSHFIPAWIICFVHIVDNVAILLSLWMMKSFLSDVMSVTGSLVVDRECSGGVTTQTECWLLPLVCHSSRVLAAKMMKMRRANRFKLSHCTHSLKRRFVEV